jgi:hypothetical protein
VGSQRRSATSTASARMIQAVHAEAREAAAVRWDTPGDVFVWRARRCAETVLYAVLDREGVDIDAIAKQRKGQGPPDAAPAESTMPLSPPPGPTPAAPLEMPAPTGARRRMQLGERSERPLRELCHLGDGQDLLSTAAGRRRPPDVCNLERRARESCANAYGGRHPRVGGLGADERGAGRQRAPYVKSALVAGAARPGASGREFSLCVDATGRAAVSDATA